MRARAVVAVTCAVLCILGAGAFAGPAAAAPAASAQAQPSARDDVVRTEPGSAQAAAGPAPAAPVDGSARLGWAALASAAASMLLGAAALTLALRARADARASGADPQTAERLARLDDVVRELAAAARRTPAAPPETRAAFPPPGGSRESAPATERAGFPPPASSGTRKAEVSGDAAPSGRREAVVVAPSAPSRPGPDDLAVWGAELTDAFARLARDPSGAANEFIARHRPRGAAVGVDGIGFVDDLEGAKLWAVRAPGEGEVWALTPGEQAAVNWSAHFAPQRREVAAEVFGAAFDLVDGGGEALRMEAPAFVRRDASGRLTVRRRGRLAGFRG